MTSSFLIDLLDTLIDLLDTSLPELSSFRAQKGTTCLFPEPVRQSAQAAALHMI
jgi:hypothetical protein